MKLKENVKGNDQALQAARLNLNPGPTYAERKRKWQGIPTIERTEKSGRLWAAFYSGGCVEGPDNYVILIRSDDDGRSWTEPILTIDPPGRVRAFDPCLWHDPQGKLWLFWAQSWEKTDGRCGVWAITCSDPEQPSSIWSEPRRIANGIMMNKPTVLSTGEWLLPCAIWTSDDQGPHDLPEERFSNIYVSRDQGATFTLHGRADVEGRSCDEHMVVELHDGRLWMLVRLYEGIGESFSADRGRTWSPGAKTDIAGPNSRFFIRRLKSGRLLLVNHYRFTGRNHLTAMLSDDDGVSWHGCLMLDERANVSYPDGVQTEDGTIYIVYDRERFKDGEILMAVFTEEDVLNGRLVSDKSRLKWNVSRLQ